MMQYPMLGDIQRELVLRGSPASVEVESSSSDQWFQEYTDRMMINHLLLLEDHLLDYAREPADQCLSCMFWHIAKIRAYASLECVKFSEGEHKQACISISPFMDKLEAEMEEGLSGERSLEIVKEVREWRYTIAGFQSDDTQAEEAKVLEPVLMATNAAAGYPTGCELVELARDKCHSESPWRTAKGCDLFLTELFGQVCRGQPPGHILGEKLHRVEATCEIISSRHRHLLHWFGGGGAEILFLVELEEKGRKIDQVMVQLENGVKGILESDNYQQYLLTMSRFHKYSLGNIMLIGLQKPDASLVAGYVTWKDMGRWVKKGEKGIAILAPCLPPKPKEPPETAEEELIEEPIVHFRVVHVFDLSQTEGEEVPTFEVLSLTGAVSESLWNKMMNFAGQQGLAIDFEPKPGMDPDIKGYLTPAGEIWVKPDEPKAQQGKTLLHEEAHHVAGHHAQRFGLSRGDIETVAESVAFVVGAHFGFDTGVRSFPYVALWAKDMAVLKRNLAAVQKVAKEMIDAMEVLPRKEVAMSSNPGKNEDLCLTVRDTEMVCSTKSYAHDVVRCQSQVEKLAEFTCGAAMTFEPPKAGRLLRAEFPQAAEHHSLTPTWQTVCLMPHAGRGIEVALVGDHSIKFVGPPWVHIFADYAKGKGLEAYSFLPCKCGYFGHPTKECTCTIGEINKQQAKIKAQYTDLTLDVPDPPADSLVAFFKGESRCEAEERVMRRVEKAKEVTFEDGKTIRPDTEPLLKAAIRQLYLDARAVDSIRSVAISVARLAESSFIGASHLAEAIQYRPRNPGMIAAKGVLTRKENRISRKEADVIAKECKGLHVGLGIVECRDPRLIEFYSDVIGERCQHAMIEDMKVVGWEPVEIVGIDHVRVGGGISIGSIFHNPIYRIRKPDGAEDEAGSLVLRGCTKAILMSSNPGIGEALGTGAGIGVGLVVAQRLLEKKPGNPHDNPIALSECEKEHGLGPKLGRCIGHVEEKNIERGCPPGGLGTSECPNVYAVCRASISQPVCPVN